jgi:hypothetical protein
LAVFPVTWLTVVPIVVPIAGPTVRGIDSFGLILGVIFGSIVGLNRGGSAVIKHYALRLTLWWNGYAPLDFTKFLDQCAKLMFLKKVAVATSSSTGCCSIFFADLPQSAKGENRKTE